MPLATALDRLWPSSAPLRRQIGPRALLRKLLVATERVERGWAAEDSWSMDVHLARVTGEMLCHLADNTHVWPGEEHYESFEAWSELLRRHGTALVAYAEGRFNGPEQEAWLNHRHSASPDPARSEELFQEMRAAEQKRYEAAQAAFLFVAENLGFLWD